jgi:uncharacterized protein (DUF2062 family)
MIKSYHDHFQISQQLTAHNFLSVSKICHYFREQISLRVLIPISNIRKQKFSSETLALSVSIGIIGGSFPVFGFATYVCLLLTLVFKQNIIIVQVANWLVYPLQIILLIPLMKLGNAIITGGDLQISMHQIVVAFQSGLLNGIREIGIISLYGVIAWVAIAIPCLFILYALFLILFKNMKRIKFKTRIKSVIEPVKQIDHIIPAAASLISETLPVKIQG